MNDVCNMVVFKEAIETILSSFNNYGHVLIMSKKY